SWRNAPRDRRELVSDQLAGSARLGVTELDVPQLAAGKKRCDSEPEREEGHDEHDPPAPVHKAAPPAERSHLPIYARGAPGVPLAEGGPLCRDELGDPRERQLQDLVEVTAREGPALGGALDLDELALPGGDDDHAR